MATYRVYHSDANPNVFGDYPIECEQLQPVDAELDLIGAKKKSAEELATLMTDGDVSTA